MVDVEVDQRVEVPRMKRPVYPRKWLVSGLVFGEG